MRVMRGSRFGSRRTLAAIASSSLLMASFLATSCDDDDDDGAGGTTSESFECTSDRTGWEQCDSNKVQYCHVDHFHWGMDCDSEGYTCVEHGDHEASCVDESTTCLEGDHQCTDNDAYNCLNGSWAIEICGSSTCQDSDDGALCESGGEGGQGGGTSLPVEACEEFQDDTPEDVTAVTSFDDYGDCHMDLDTPIHLAIPDNQTSYCHFPVTETGTYVVFLDTADAFATIYHRTDGEIDPAPSGGVANSECPTVLVDHYHADLEMDGTDPPVPYILEIQPISGGSEVGIIIKRDDD